MHKQNAILIIAVAFVLAAPCGALAGEKKPDTSAGNGSPSESVHLNYTKTQTEYKQTKKGAGKPSTSAAAAKGGMKH